MQLPKKYGGRGKNQSKKKQSAPSSADDVLAIGVDFEEAGEKWRAGDKAKSSRFFIKALDAYENGLQSFPKSFDLAYNRARLFYELTQQPGHIAYIRSSGMMLLTVGGTLPTDTTALLDKALELHLCALQLDGSNADTLFNAGQIRRSLAEAVDEDLPAMKGSINTKLSHLQEAVALFERCFFIQDHLYRATEDPPISTVTGELENMIPDSSQKSPDSGQKDEEMLDAVGDYQDGSQEQWASIETQITEATLMDTCLAEMEALAMIVPIISDDASHLEKIEAQVVSLTQRAEGYAQRLANEETTVELCQTRAKAASALLFESFKANQITAEWCTDQLNALLDYSGRDSSADALSEAAEARLAFNAICMIPLPPRSHLPSQPSYALPRLPHQWRQLGAAMKHLSVATDIPGIPSPWLFYSRKADVELYRCRLAEEPFHHEPAIQNREVMLKNAEVWYRGAEKLARASGEQEFASDMVQRERVVKKLRGVYLEVAQEPSGEVVAEMRQEGLVTRFPDSPSSGPQSR